ncbi:hypothetical protein [Burkholderia sp. BCC1972]|uniref:hypothetical protein n=1 Tax=Burkholderia sp. BCC1972 TaxID=2817438 RepID=UPI002ABDF570|nr:hypothetical protein [Burkholderia sp. BCC1972]
MKVSIQQYGYHTFGEGMEHIRQVQSTHVFSRAAPEAVLLLNTDNLPYLADIRLTFWLESTFPSSNLQTSEISDLRIYLDGEDISAAVASGLADALRASPTATTQYAAALNRWLTVFDREAPLAGLSPEMVSQTKTLASKYPTLDWSTFFSKLATKGFGYRGGLHPLHFIHRDIVIAPLSLRQILFPNTKDEERPFSKLRDSRLVFSHGPSRFYSSSWSPVDLQYEGLLTASAASVFDDAWEEEMRERMLQLASKMADISDQVTELRKMYSDFEKRATEFKAISDGIDSSLQELITCRDQPQGG